MWTPTPVSAKRTRLAVLPLEDRSMPATYTAATVAELVADIDAANLTPEADTIHLVFGTTYTLNAANNTASGPTGLPVVAAGEDLTVLGHGATIERTSAAGTPAFRLFAVEAGAALRLTELTLQGGLALGVTTQNSDWSQGGAVHNRGTLDLAGVIVQNNTAQGRSGGGVGFGGFVGATSGFGGGLYSAGILTATGCVIRNNAAIGGRGLDALRSGPPVVIQSGPPGLPTVGGLGGDGLGGGLYVAGGSAAIGDSTISGGTARGGAGGNGFVKPSGKTTAAGDGGDGLGGGLYAAGGVLSVRHASVTDNQALGGLGGTANPANLVGQAGKGKGGGLFIDASAWVGLDVFTKNHVKQNQASNNGNNISGPYDLIS